MGIACSPPPSQRLQKGLIRVVIKPRSGGPGNETAFDFMMVLFSEAERGSAQAALRRVIRKAIPTRNEISPSFFFSPLVVLMNLIAGTFIIPHGFK